MTREIGVTRALHGGAFATALVGLYALASAGPVGPLPILVLGGASVVAAWRLLTKTEAPRELPSAFRTGLLTLCTAGVVIPIHALLSRSYLLAAVDLLAILQANRLLVLRAKGVPGQVLLVSLLMLLGAAVLTLRVEFLAAVFLFCLAGTWTAFFRSLGESAPGEKVPLSVAWVALGSGAGVFVLTLLLFAVLPRLRLSSASGGVLQVQGVSGFSEEVKLGEIGTVKQDFSPVMRVTLSGPPVPEDRLYWRGIALDRYQQGRWQVSDPWEQNVEGQRTEALDSLRATQLFRLTDLRGAREKLIRQDFILEPLDVSVLFLLAPAVEVRGDLPQVSRNSTDSLFFRARRFGRTRYQVGSRPAVLASEALLARQPIAPGSKPERWLQVPKEVAEAIRPLAFTLGGPDSDPPFRRARRIESALQTWQYSLEAKAGAHPDPVVSFLLDTRTGWCEQFSSGMVLLLRTLGIPARMANGFHGGERNEFGDFWLVRRSDAHSWVEVPFEGAGWVIFDPTPPAGTRGTHSNRVLRGLDYLRLLWTQRVVEYNILDQFELVDSGVENAHRFVEGLSTPSARRMATRVSGALLGLALLGGGGLLLLRNRPPRALSPEARAADRLWVRIERRLAREGFHRNRGETPGELAARAGRPEWAEIYYLARFGGRALTPAERETLERVREEVG